MRRKNKARMKEVKLQALDNNKRKASHGTPTQSRRRKVEASTSLTASIPDVNGRFLGTNS
jgi:hypothetical protein